MNDSKGFGSHFALLCEAFGTTPAKGRMLLIGVVTLLAGWAIFFALMSDGASFGDALVQAIGWFWPGSVLIAPGIYDLICKGWSLDHHAKA
jgi:hypothetical protein